MEELLCASSKHPTGQHGSPSKSPEAILNSHHLDSRTSHYSEALYLSLVMAEPHGQKASPSIPCNPGAPLPVNANPGMAGLKARCPGFIHRQLSACVSSYILSAV